MTLQLNTIHNGDALEILRTLPDNSIDAVVTDPPYGIEFMGKDWDRLVAPTGGATFTPDGIGKGFKALPSYKGSPNPTCKNCGGTQRGNDRKGFTKCRCDKPDFPNVGLKQSQAQQEWHYAWAKEVLRVLKPGGHLLAFGGSRTYHRMACGIENVGFEIRDMIEWLYLSGFPKSMNVGKQFDKQAGAEREVVGYRKHPTLRDTSKVDRQGIQQFHSINAIRDEWELTAPSTPLAKQWDGWGTALKPAHEPVVMARKPLIGTVCANVEQYGTGAINVDECRIGDGSDSIGERDGEATADARYTYNGSTNFAAKPGVRGGSPNGRFPANCITTDDDAWYRKYFNVTPQEVSKKANKRDRGEDNHHPTVKPIALMSWLIRLVTPPNGIVLDPFAGSGSTLVAAKREGFSYIGIERESEYVDIAQRRLSGESA